MDLPKLTDKQQKYLDNLLTGMSQVDAYRGAFDCEKTSQAAVYVEASRLTRNPKIALRLKAVQDETQKASTYTLQQHIDELNELKEAAIQANQLGPAVAACEKMGRVQGMYVEKHEDVTQGNDQELLQAINALLGPEAARNAAKMMGIEDETEH